VARLQQLQERAQHHAAALQQAEQQLATARLEARRLAAQAGAGSQHGGAAGPGVQLLRCFRLTPEVAAGGGAAGLPPLEGALAGLAAIAGERLPACLPACLPAWQVIGPVLVTAGTAPAGLAA
jgi:hypothetical protein